MHSINMKDNLNISSHEFWDNCYEHDDTGCDLGGPTPIFVDWCNNLDSSNVCPHIVFILSFLILLYTNPFYNDYQNIPYDKYARYPLLLNHSSIQDLLLNIHHISHYL